MNNELYHYGVIGMKWGVRRYQNPDGSLTDKGRKRLHAKYDKLITSSQKRIKSDEANTSRYVKAYNNMASRMNNGITEKYNAKYGNYKNDKEYQKYVAGYEKLSDKIFTEEWNKQLKSDITNDRGMKKVFSLMEKYGRDSLSDIAREAIEDYEKIDEKGKYRG